MLAATMDNLDKEILNEIQWTFPLTSQPYHDIAKKFKITPEIVKERLNNLKKIGVLRQLSAIFDTRKLGYKSSLVAMEIEPDKLDYVANGMIVWKVPEERITDVGGKLGAFPQVSHCYQRPVYPDWPYNVFSMIHCKSEDEAQEMAKTIQKQINVDDYKILFSAREFKKTRVEYFVEQNFSLEETIPA